MSATVGYATLNIVPSTKGFASKLGSDIIGMSDATGKKAGESINTGVTAGVGKASKLASVALGAIGGIAALGVGQAISAVTALVGEAVTASDATDKFKQTLQFAGLKTDAIDRVTAQVRAYADQTVYSLGDVQNTAAQLAANGIPNYVRLTEAAGNLNAVAGGNSETFKSVAMALTQTAGAGKLTTENWNQIADAIPGASGVLQKALKDAGAYTGNFRDAMAAGQITAGEFNTALQKVGMSDVAKKAATSTSTIEGAVGNLKASIVGLLSDGVSKVKPAITGAIGVLASGISAIGPFLSQVGSVVGPFVAQLGAAVGPAFAELGQAVMALAPNLSPVMIAFQALTPVLPQLGALLNHVATVIAGNLTVALQTLQPITQAVTDVLSGILAAALPVVADLFAALAPVLHQATGALAQIAQAVTPLVIQLESVLMPIIQALLPVVRVVFDTIANVIKAAMTIISGVIKVVTSAIKGDWSGVWDGIKQIAKGVWDGIKSLVSGAINIVMATIKAVLGTISSIWSSVWGGIRDFLGGIWNGIKTAASNAIGGLIGLVTGIKDKVLGALSGAGKWLWDAGVNVVRGLLNGIQSLAGTVGRFFLDLLPGWIVGPFKAALGIHSPSRLFHGFGGYIGQGLIDGMRKQKAGVAAQARDLATAAADGFAKRQAKLDVRYGVGAAPVDASAAIAASKAARRAERVSDMRAALVDRRSDSLGGINYYDYSTSTEDKQTKLLRAARQLRRKTAATPRKAA